MQLNCFNGVTSVANTSICDHSNNANPQGCQEKSWGPGQKSKWGPYIIDMYLLIAGA